MRLKLHSKAISLFLIAFIIIAAGCRSHYFIVKNSYDQTGINNVQNPDSNVVKIIMPYHDSLIGKMNEVIAISRVTLKKEQPEGSLGNLVCDLIMQHYSALQPDLCVVNNGGLRIGQIKDGDITMGKIYELMPFDNSMMLLYINGKQLKQLFEKVASKNGWPVSVGVSLQIEKGKLNSAYLQGNEINESKTYKLLVSDYLANGGDDCTMLKGSPRMDLKELCRDVLIAEIKLKHQKGEKIASSIDGRITEIK